MDVDNLVLALRKLDDELNEYRMYWETSADWQSRKQFLAHNWNNHTDKEKLISLSCAWANVRFLGNYYPRAVMHKLKEMEEGLELSADKSKSDLPSQPKANIVPLLYNPDKLPKNFIQVRFVKSTYINDSKASAADNNETNISGNPAKSAFITGNGEETQSFTFDRQTNSPPKHKISDSSNTDCEKLTKKLKKALKIPENLSQKTTAENLASVDSSVQIVHSCNIVDATCKNRALTLERFASVIKNQMTSNPSDMMSYFFNTAIDLALSPKFVCGMSSEVHVMLFNHWGSKNKVQHSLTNYAWVCDIYIGEVYLSQGYGKTVAIAKEKAVSAAIDALKNSFIVCNVSRIISPSMCALQYAVKLKYLDNFEFPPIVTLQGAPVIKITNATQSSRPPSKTVENHNHSNITVKNEINVSQSCHTSSNIAIEKLNQANVESKSAIPKQKPVSSEDKKQTDSIKLSDTSLGNQDLTEDLNLKRTLMTRLRRDLSNFVVVVFADNDDPVQSLSCTMSMNKISLSYKYESSFRIVHIHTCSVFMNNVMVATESATSKDFARLSTATKLLRHLVAYFPCLIKLRVPEKSDKALKRSDFTSNMKSKHVDNPIAANNIGNQLLRKMGWSGSGGLGKLKDGIAEPIQATGKLSRSVEGLGHDPISIVKHGDAERVIRQYISNGCVGNLTFSSELTSEDRKKIHLVARKNGLKSKSFGQGTKRYLMLFKNLSLPEIYQELIRTGGELNGYILPK